MKNLLFALALVLSPLAASAESALPAFGFTGIAALRAEKAVISAPAPRPSDVIVDNHMLLQAGPEVLFGYADTREQFVEAVARWSDVLRAAGIEPGTPTYSNSFFTLPYRTTDGRSIRAFLADPRQFPPKDETGLRADMARSRGALAAAGLTPISARVVNLEHLLPTYSILYLAKPEPRRERETQLRVLQANSDVDAGLLRASDVTLLEQPKPWLAVYVGPALGHATLIAKTAEDLARHLESRKTMLAAAGKRIVGEKLEATSDSEYTFGAQLLFFQ